MAQASAAMWCTARTRTCPSERTRSSRARSSGATPRSNGRAVSAATRADTSASARSAGSALRSVTGRARAAGCSITWTGTPSSASKRVRSTSCRAASSVSARSSAPVSRPPVSRSTRRMTYSALSGTSWSSSQSRSCAKEARSGPFRSTRRIGGMPSTGSASGPWSPPALTISARPATVGAAKTLCTPRPSPNSWRSWETAWVARREWPPSSKKLSSAPTRSTPRTCSQTRAMDCCTGVAGATYSWPVRGRAASGAGRARRSTLPLAVSGTASITTVCEGSM